MNTHVVNIHVSVFICSFFGGDKYLGVELWVYVSLMF